MSSVHPTSTTFRNFTRFQRDDNRHASTPATITADWPLIAMYLIALLGLGISSYLGWAGLTSTKVAGCGAGQVFDCSHVLTSKWSTVFGIPVGLPAAGVYLTMIGGLATLTFSKTGQVKDLSKIVLSISAFSAAMAAVWFISLQLFVVEHLCSYCLAAHTCGLLIAGLVSWRYPLSTSRTLGVAVTALASVALLAAVQWSAEAPKTYEIETFAPVASSSSPEVIEPEGELFSAPGFDSTDENIFAAPIESTMVESPIENDQVSNTRANVGFGLIQLFNPTALIAFPVQEKENQATQQAELTPAPPRLVGINGGQSKLNVAHWPLCGKRDAECIFVEMFDYTCPHCRENHQTIKQVTAQLGEDKFAILALAVPMNHNCNSGVTHTDANHAEACELAKLAISVWRVDPSKFGEFHDWMFTELAAPSYVAAMAKAERLVDRQKLARELEKGVASNYVATQVKLYNQVGAGAIPKMMFPTTTVSGKIGSPESLVQIIRQQFNQ